MKKTFFLIGALGLLLTTGTAAGDETEWVTTEWNDQDGSYTQFHFDKNSKLVISLGDEDEAFNLGGAALWNGVIIKSVNDSSASINAEKSEDEDNPGYYTYGALELSADSNVKLGERTTQISDKNYAYIYTTVGTLALGDNSTLTLENRLFEITGLPYVSLGKNAKVVLSAAGTSLGTLSMGPASVTGKNSVVVTGADKKEGYITNTSDETATLGTSTAKDVEYKNVKVTVNGSADSTEIVAKFGNVNLVNATTGKEIIISGGTIDGTTSVKQINTGQGGNTTGGNVTLLNRGETSLKMEGLNIGKELTVTARQGADTSSTSKACVIEMQAYDSNLNQTSDVEMMLTAASGAKLNADLVLGTGDDASTTVIYFTEKAFGYGKTDASKGYGLDMMGNNVTLKSGITDMAFAWIEPLDEGDTEVLMFSNVNKLTLGSGETDSYDGIYFDYTEGISASEYFSTEVEDWSWASIAAPTEDADGNLTGWFMEYRDNGAGDGTGDVYMVYRTVAAIPEPTTATLSLLALAGLVARRRRASR